MTKLLAEYKGETQGQSFGKPPIATVQAIHILRLLAKEEIPQGAHSIEMPADGNPATEGKHLFAQVILNFQGHLF